jgi:hypothetical protein
MSITNYLSLDNKDVLLGYDCKKCNTVSKFVRIFNPSSSRISKGKEEILNEAKEEARKIVNKIKSGDTKAILDVYGETL